MSFLSAVSLGFALAMLAGCGPSPQAAIPVSGQQSVVRRAKTGALLYSASNQYGTVTIYTYPQAQEMTSFNVPGDPAGLCSDKAGDVFMAEPYGRMVEEYKHGQTSPSASFSFPPSPYGCAVDDASKQLAVANEGGSVGIFDLSSKGSNPTTYTYPGIESFFFCSYDSQGNLFVDGQAFSGPTLLFELRKGQSSLKIVKIPVTLPYSATVQWDGTYLAVYNSGKNNYAKVLRVAVNNSERRSKGVSFSRGHEPIRASFGFTRARSFRQRTGARILLGGRIPQAENRSKLSRTPATRLE
ncbi:MAG TPA: hypothetical protein VHR97_00110 [Candidatus Baltobacteraceae bacterium]|jgi:hypothetical protein|nr:hypothetical protein [Candidatus Baltobacteraceae bacterium]